jgi:GAF domain-containing protein
MTVVDNDRAGELERENAGLRRRLAEREAELAEALEQQTATAEVLQVINSSPGDLTPVFEAILGKAHGLCGVAFGSLELYDGGKLCSVALRGLSGPLAELSRQPHEPTPGSPASRLLGGEQIVRITDMAELVKQQPGDPRAREAAEDELRTALFVPLRKGETLLGTISAGRKEVRPFTDKEIGLLQNFAAQAVIAMENARLLRELRQRTDEIAGWNCELEARVAAQVEELGRVGRLKRFLAPQLAELIVSQGDEKILESHRRDIVVVFAICAATPPLPRPPSLRKSSTSYASIMARWGRLSPSSRARSTSSRATGSWCSSTIPYHVPTRPPARSRWRWQCARRRAS